MSTFKRVFCFFTSLCLSFVAVWFQPVEVSAIEQDILDSWSDYMQEFDQMLDDAGSKLDNAYNELNDSLDTALEDIAQNTYNAALTQYANLSYMIQYMTISSINSNLDVPQPASAVVGWYIYNGKWYPCTVYQYDQNSPVQMSKYALCTSSQHFYSAVIAPDVDGIIRVSQNVYNSSNFGYFCTVNGVYTNWSGIASNLGDYNASRWFSLLGYRPSSPGDDLTNMIDAKQIYQLQLTGQDGYYPSKHLGYRDDMPESISPIHLTFIPGSISGFIDDLKTNLVDNYGNDTYINITVLPDDPVSPEYPTDFVTGIPRSWTIENPPLPTSPHIDFGQGDFDFSKPSEYLEEVVNEAEALDFWWWLSEKTFKRCGVFEYFLAFITLGFAMYALWRWGS